MPPGVSRDVELTGRDVESGTRRSIPFDRLIFEYETIGDGPKRSPHLSWESNPGLAKAIEVSNLLRRSFKDVGDIARKARQEASVKYRMEYSRYWQYLNGIISLGKKGIYDIRDGEGFQAHLTNMDGVFALHEGNHRALSLCIIGEECLDGVTLVPCCPRAKVRGLCQ